MARDLCACAMDPFASVVPLGVSLGQFPNTHSLDFKVLRQYIQELESKGLFSNVVVFFVFSPDFIESSIIVVDLYLSNIPTLY